MSRNSVQTFNGNRFDFDKPFESVIELRDIAVALSRLPRFTGHTTRVYTVAEHAIAVAMECFVLALRADFSVDLARQVALCGQHHDDAEYVVGDISSPLKAHLGVSHLIKPTEIAVDNAIVGPYVSAQARAEFHRRFVKPADLRMLRWESENLLPGGRREDWPLLAGVRLPAIDVGVLFALMPEPEDAFLALHEALVHHKPLPMWTHCCAELGAHV